jgi:hypothetical protein
MWKNPTLYAYHHTSSLVFQFVLNDFLLTLEEASVVNLFTFRPMALDEFFGDLTRYLIKLAGSEQEYQRIFSWIIDAGILTKLKTNSELLAEKGAKSDNDYMELLNAAHKSWLHCIHAVDLLRDVEKARGSIADLKMGVEKALASIQKLKPAIEKIIPKYAHDENVLYFILRHHAHFDRHMGVNWTRNLFSTLHPQGIWNFMKERYETRGFHDHLPMIEQKLVELSA